MTYYNIDYLYVDYGAGDTNIEELSLYGKSHPELGLNKKLRVIDSGATVDHYDHVLQKHVKKRNKSLMVSFSVISLEEGMFILPKEEDTNTRLVGQMREYKVKNVTSRGEFSYEGEDHILDAFNLAVYGFQQNYGSLLTTKVTYNIGLCSDPRASMFPQRQGSIISPIKVNNYSTYSMPIRDPDKPVSFQKPQRREMPRFKSRSLNIRASYL